MDDISKIKDYLLKTAREIRYEKRRGHIGFLKRLTSAGKPSGVARFLAKMYIKTDGDLFTIIRTRFPTWSYSKHKEILDNYPNIYDLTYFIICTEWGFNTYDLDETINYEIILSIIGGFAEAELFNFLDLRSQLEDLLLNSNLISDLNTLL